MTHYLLGSAPGLLNLWDSFARQKKTLPEGKGRDLLDLKAMALKIIGRWRIYRLLSGLRLRLASGGLGLAPARGLEPGHVGGPLIFQRL